MRQLFAAMAFAGMGALTACGVAGPTARRAASEALRPSLQDCPSISVAGGVVKVNTHQGGGEALAIKLARPNGAGYGSQSLIHRWVAADVTEYDVALNVGTGAGMNALTTVQVFPKASQPQTEAIFSGLRVGVPYVLTVLAKGNLGGDPNQPTRVLNTQNPANALILFTSYDNNDIDNAKSVSVAVQLDSVPFSGTATGSITTVDGTYSALAESESGSAT